MQRIRTVKPELFLHEELFDLEYETGLPVRLAFIGLFTCCDREGRFKWKPRTLKASIFPHDELDFSRVLDALTTRGFVQKYATNTGEFGVILTFKRHQVINNRERDSELPEPPPNITIDATTTREPRDDHADIAERKGKERKGIKEKIVKKENPAAESLPVANATQQQKRGTRLPTDWQPRDAEIQFCRNERPDLNPLSVAEQFVDYWTAATGAKATKMDWPATWRNWVRNQRRSAAQADTRTEHQKRDDATTRAIFGDYLHQSNSGFDNLKTIDGDFYETTKKLG